jgi:hypothetical protein
LGKGYIVIIQKQFLTQPQVKNELKTDFLKINFSLLPLVRKELLKEKSYETLLSDPRSLDRFFSCTSKTDV